MVNHGGRCTNQFPQFLLRSSEPVLVDFLADRQDVLPDPLHCHPSVLDGRQDLNLPPPAALAAAPRRRQRPRPRSEPLTWSAPLSAKELVADTRGQPQSPQKASGAMRAATYARDFTRGSCGRGADTGHITSLTSFLSSFPYSLFIFILAEYLKIIVNHIKIIK